MVQGNGARRQERDPYAAVGARARQSVERALAGGATSGERAVLAGVHYWLVTYSRFGEYLSLGQVAQSAGLWADVARDCPKPVKRVVSQRLRRLDELGCLDYEPGGAGGRGSASWIGLAPVVEGGGRGLPSWKGCSDPTEANTLSSAERVCDSSRKGEVSVNGKGEVSGVGRVRGQVAPPHPPEGSPRSTEEEPEGAVARVARFRRACSAPGAAGQDESRAAFVAVVERHATAGELENVAELLEEFDIRRCAPTEWLRVIADGEVPADFELQRLTYALSGDPDARRLIERSDTA